VSRNSAEFRNQGTIFGGIGPISDQSPPIQTLEFRNKDNYIQQSKKTFIQQIIVLECRLLNLFHTNPQNHNNSTENR